MDVVEGLGIGPFGKIDEDSSQFQPPAIIILGPPSAGKTTLAKHLAQQLRCEHIGGQEVLALAIAAADAKALADAKAEKARAKEERRLAKEARKEAEGDNYVSEGEDDEDEDEEDEEDEDEEDEEDDDEDGPKVKPRIPVPTDLTDDAVIARELLISGKAIPTELMLKLVSQRVEAPTTRFRGYIVEGLTTTSDTSDDVQQILKSMAQWTLPPKRAIQLTMNDEDVLHRLGIQVYNPDADVIMTSTEVAQAKSGDEEEEEEEVDEQDDNGDDDDDDDDEDKPVIEDPPVPITLPSRPLVNYELFEGAVQRPSEVNALSILKQYNACVKNAELEFLASFPVPDRFIVEATRPDHLLAAELLNSFDNRGDTRLCEPIVLDELEGEHETDEAMLEEMAGSNLPEPEEDDEDGANIEAWKVSSFGAHCPVTLSEEKRIVKGNVGCGVAYMGFVYALADKAAQKKFAVNPIRYLRTPSIAPCRVLITQGVSNEECEALSSTLGIPLHKFEEATSNTDGGVDEKNEIPEEETTPQKGDEVAEVAEGEATPSDEAVKENVVPLSDVTSSEEIAPPKGDETVESEVIPSNEATLTEEDKSTEVTQIEAPPVDKEDEEEDAVQNDEAVAAVENTSEPVAEVVAVVKPTIPADKWLISNVPQARIEEVLSDLKLSAPCCVVTLPPTSAEIKTDETTEDNGDDAEVQGKSENDASKYASKNSIPLVSLDKNDVGLTAARVMRELESLVQPGPLDKEHEDYDPEETEKDTEMGATNLYCPVTLERDNILQPGKQETAAKFRGKWYHMATEEARDTFVADPCTFVSGNLQPPPPRICLLGAPFSGKTVHGRRLARRFRLFHVSFHEKIAEIAADTSHTHHQVCKDSLSDEDPTPLTPEIIVEILTPYWRSEPYRSSGILMEGFPRNEDDARAATEAGLYPDVAVTLAMEATTAVQRGVPRAVAKFKAYRDAVLAKRAKIAADKRAAFNGRKDAWLKKKEEERSARVREREAAKRIRMAEPDYNSEDDEEEEEDEDEDEEYEDPEEFQEEEQEEEELEELEEAQERITDEVTDKHEEQNEAAVGIVELFTEELRVPAVEVNAGRREEAVRTSIDRAIERFLPPVRQSLLAYARSISAKDAAKLLSLGALSLSKFGTWCPVDLANQRTFQPIVGGRYPAVYLDEVYYMSSDENRKKFIKDVIKFIQQPSPPDEVPVCLSIVGPPKSGKTALAKELCKRYGCKYVTASDAISDIVAADPPTAMSRKLSENLHNGRAATVSEVAYAVAQSLSTMHSQTRGYILDGYPISIEDQNALQEAVSIVRCSPLVLTAEPVRQMICMESDYITRLSRAQSEWGESNESVSADEAELAALVHHQMVSFAERDAALSQSIETLEKETKKSTGCWFTLDATKSKWWLAVKAGEIIQLQVKQTQIYLNHLSAKLPAPIAGVGFGFEQVAQGLSTNFDRYCPVSWCLHMKLVKADPVNLQYTVHFDNHFYQLADLDSMSRFIHESSSFVSGTLPEILPRSCIDAAEVKSLLQFPKQLEFAGFCTVTYVQHNRRYEFLKPASQDFAVEYGGRIFAFFDAEARDSFMLEPHLYANEPLPAKLPPKAKPVNVNALPMLGYMEQTVALLLTKAIAAVGVLKPKYPYLDMAQSASLYIALYLKAHNPKSTPYARQMARKRLKKFESKAELTRYLGANAPESFDGEKPADFSPRMTEFLAAGSD